MERIFVVDDDTVAFVPVEVCDDIIADHVDPVVVDVGVLASHPVPADGAVIVGMFLDEAFLGIDERLEVEDVAARTAGQDIVCRDRLIGIELAVGQLVIRIAFVAVRVIGDRSLASVRAGDQQIVAGPAIEEVLAMATVKHVIAVATIAALEGHCRHGGR
ncbi:hypothetical protein CHH27_00025 [Labrenzia sp. VG12]|nr:hypothetical protein CHH27_00025 [Labrenzia sp. VG12]